MRIHSGSGDTYVDSGYSGPNGSNAWSVCGRFRGDGSAVGATGWQYSFGHELSVAVTATGAGSEIIEVNLWRNNTTGELQLALFMENNAGSVSCDCFSSGDPFTLGTDFRWCITYDGSTSVRAWVDGAEITFDASGPFGPSVTPSGTLSFAGLTGGLDIIADQASAVGDLAWWHRALTPTEAAAATSLSTPDYPATLAYHREMQGPGENETVSGTNNETIVGGSWATHTPVATIPGPLAITHASPTELLEPLASSIATQVPLAITHASPTELLEPGASSVALQTAQTLTHAVTELVAPEASSLALQGALGLTHGAPTEVLEPGTSSISIAGQQTISHTTPTELLEPLASSLALQGSLSLTHAVTELVAPEASSLALQGALGLTHGAPTEVLEPGTSSISIAGQQTISHTTPTELLEPGASSVALQTAQGLTHAAPTDLVEPVASTIATQAPLAITHATPTELLEPQSTSLATIGGQTISHTTPTELLEPGASSVALQTAQGLTHAQPTELLEPLASSMSLQTAQTLTHAAPTELLEVLQTFISIGAPFNVDDPIDVHEREIYVVTERNGPHDVTDRAGQSIVVSEGR